MIASQCDNHEVRVVRAALDPGGSGYTLATNFEYPNQASNDFTIANLFTVGYIGFTPAINTPYDLANFNPYIFVTHNYVIAGGAQDDGSYAVLGTITFSKFCSTEIEGTVVATATGPTAGPPTFEGALGITLDAHGCVYSTAPLSFHVVMNNTPCP